MRWGGFPGRAAQGFCDNKPAGRVLEHMRCGRPIKILPHTSESQLKMIHFPPSPTDHCETQQVEHTQASGPQSVQGGMKKAGH